MKYREDKYGQKISCLGFGCMRLTHKGREIDFEATQEQICKAVELGINYFDTAYIYPGSEEALGKVLKNNDLRDQVYIADKLPQYMIKSNAAIEKYFQEQLTRLQTDHIDYYLMHMLTDIEAWNNLKKRGIVEWIDAKKKDGSIRNIGFSFHGNTEMFLKILNDYDWDMCQIQYNYMDENSQAGRAGLQEAAKRGIPVIIMEPLRGGKLVTLLPEKAKKRIAESHWNPAELAFRWLWDQPEVTCVLSGMNSLEMVEENALSASKDEALTTEDLELIEEVKTLINEKIKVPCTACGYCMPCPRGVDIPQTFRCWNEMYMENRHTGRFEYFQVVGMRKEPGFATQCVACGRCESHCPQHIHIIEMLKKADKDLRPMPYRIGSKLAGKIMLR